MVIYIAESIQASLTVEAIEERIEEHTLIPD
jgi:hypothetical protein